MRAAAFRHEFFEHPVTDPLLCSRSAELWGQTAAQAANSGTYDKTVCLWVPETR